MFDDLDPSLPLQVGDDVICPAKAVGDARYVSQDPFIHALNQRCPIQSQLQSVLGVRSYYVEWN